jgi:hypothetical protein
VKTKIDEYLLSPLKVDVPAGLNMKLDDFHSSMRSHIKKVLDQEDRDKAIMEALLYREDQALSLLNQVLKAATDTPAPTRQIKKILSEKLVLRDEQGSITGLLEVSP